MEEKKGRMICLDNMKVLYYTLFIGFILLATIFLYYALRPVPLPAEVSESPDASWHFCGNPSRAA